MVNAQEVIAGIDTLARTYDQVGYPHEGDCAGSLCDECGHCLHSFEKCDHNCGGSGGCRDAVDDDTVRLKRATIALAKALGDVLALADSFEGVPSGAPWAAIPSAAVRAVITHALSEVAK